MVSKDQFHVWRTLLAVACAGRRLRPGEKKLLRDRLRSQKFSSEQIDILREDLKTPRDACELFQQIKLYEDRARFFEMARELIWSDVGNSYGEQEVMLKLMQANVAKTNFEEIYVSGLSLEDDDVEERFVERYQTKSADTIFGKIYTSLRTQLFG